MYFVRNTEALVKRGVGLFGEIEWHQRHPDAHYPF
jgi:hypothetical protein